MKWRTGRKNEHTMYTQNSLEPQDDDLFVGSVVDPAYAALTVQAVNAVEKLRELHYPIGEGITQVCNHCRKTDGGHWDFVTWPCPTMKIVEEK